MTVWKYAYLIKPAIGKLQDIEESGTEISAPHISTKSAKSSPVPFLEDAKAPLKLLEKEQGSAVKRQTIEGQGFREDEDDRKSRPMAAETDDGEK